MFVPHIFRCLKMARCATTSTSPVLSEIADKSAVSSLVIRTTIIACWGVSSTFVRVASSTDVQLTSQHAIIVVLNTRDDTADLLAISLNTGDVEVVAQSLSI